MKRSAHILSPPSTCIGPLHPFLMPIVACIAILGSTQSHSQSWPRIDVNQSLLADGQGDAAIIIGISKYLFLPPIDGATENADAWRNWLVNSKKVPARNVVLLQDREATRERIEKALTQLSATPGNTWFIFIGHGSPSPQGDDGLLLGVDADSDSDSLASRGVRQRVVLDALARTSTGERTAVAVFDACFSGRTPDGERPLLAGLQATLPVRKTRSGLENVAIFSASESFAGPLPGESRPAFSYLLLGALRGWADNDKDKIVTTDEAAIFSRNTLQAILKTETRLPKFQGKTLMLARGAAEPPPDIAALAARPLLSGICRSGSVCAEQPWFGATVSVLPFMPGRDYGTRPRNGVLVDRVPIGTPAAASGLRVGDIITKAANHPINTLDVFLYHTERLPIGVPSKFEVWRGNRFFITEVTPGRQTDAARMNFDRCERDDADACFDLATAFSSGKGVQTDKQRSVSLYEKSCDIGNIEACTALGFYYRNEAENMRMAEIFLARGCNGNDGKSCTQLGWLMTGVTPIDRHQMLPIDINEAVVLLRKGCKLERAYSCFLLGNLLEQMPAKATSPHEKVNAHYRACELGDRFTCSQLGSVLSDLSEAEKIRFRARACELGEIDNCK